MSVYSCHTLYIYVHMELQMGAPVSMGPFSCYRSDSVDDVGT